MKRLLIAALFTLGGLTVTAGTTVASGAFGLFIHHGCCNTCGVSCPQPNAFTPVCCGGCGYGGGYGGCGYGGGGYGGIDGCIDGSCGVTPYMAPGYCPTCGHKHKHLLFHKHKGSINGAYYASTCTDGSCGGMSYFGSEMGDVDGSFPKKHFFHKHKGSIKGTYTPSTCEDGNCGDVSYSRLEVSDMAGSILVAGYNPSWFEMATINPAVPYSPVQNPVRTAGYTPNCSYPSSTTSYPSHTYSSYPSYTYPSYTYPSYGYYHNLPTMPVGQPAWNMAAPFGNPYTPTWYYNNGVR
jgi:hypothetical protein